MHTNASLRAIHGFDASVRAPFSLGAWFARLLNRLQEAERRRSDYETLMAKDDHELSDIGLTRAEVVAGFERGRWPSRPQGRR
jgi:uncharacterized protein YjiS (DUF1127 family)